MIHGEHKVTQRKMTNNEIVIYKSNELTTSIEVKLENETVWLNLSQISELFERDKSVISRHISNIFKEGELVKESVVASSSSLYDVFLCNLIYKINKIENRKLSINEISI